MKVLIEFENKPLLFTRPKEIIRCRDEAALSRAFERMESALDRGFHLAGFLSYEAGYGLERVLSRGAKRSFPLVMMGVYGDPERKGMGRGPEESGIRVRNIRPDISYERYADQIRLIRRTIARGDVYQITHCLKLLFNFEGEALALYRRLKRVQPVPYPAYLEARPWTILSLSPEMYLKKRGTFVVAKPMKGTWPRGQEATEDRREARRFRRDAKNRAENVMIADLLRNDLGRIGRKVRAPRLFEVTPYRTLFQMTSTITARVPRTLPLIRLFKALFPSGSVTGAPKIKAMEVIREIEGERRIHTGALGYVTPERDVFFNVPIRTLLLRGGRGEMGIGGGIVWDSTPQGEWAECLLKAGFLTGNMKIPTRMNGSGWKRRKGCGAKA